ncbi:E3 ubiquitin-protein ligase RNF123 [Papilio machaon]|uniref:RING-type E3 ubiquitin transferase n=1 Tax=Papilio machaon TaxID=76193 RepID=A0A194QQ69_PAPMA|nr:E3 ubiquitin-protein ligase RNF123 [Papilio machaon]
MQKHDAVDDRAGRIGPKIVVFDASTGTGRLVLVGDERVSVQGLSSFATIRATACVYSGRWMYEAQLGTKGIMQIGWCTAGCTFSMDTGVGDTVNSYAYDGGRVRRWNVATSPYGQAWLPGDVIGSCLDLDKGTLEFYRNGVSMGVAFDNVAHGTGVAYFPAVSLAMQEHLYANFGHVPFVFPVEGFSPLQAPPTKECARATLLFKSLDAIIDELIHLSSFKTVDKKSSKAKSETSKAAEEEIAVRIDSSNSVYSPLGSPTNVLEAQGNEVKRMSRKAFLMSLARLVVIELGVCLKMSYVVIGELLTRFRGYLGLRSRSVNLDPQTAEFYSNIKAKDYEGLSEKILTQPHPKLCTLLDLLWTFLDESALCDIFEHCIVRECLLFDSVSPVKFDNFLNVKCPDESVLRTVIQKPWWQRPMSVKGETDPIIADNELNPATEDDIAVEARYKDDCAKITEAIRPLENIQLEFVLILFDNSDGSNVVPSTRKIFLEKFRRYIMDNCILDMRLFNVSRNSPAISWCCHARLLTAVLKLWNTENPLGNLTGPPHLPPKSFIDGELDFYNVDRLGGVLPFLVRTLRQDLVDVLGEDNPFIQSFEPNYNRAGGIDAGVSEMAAGSPALATLPQVISSMARFMHAAMPPMPNRTTGETALALKGTRSMMPGAGAIDVRSAYLRLLDGLLALYHGAGIKHAEKLCELRDSQLDLADCLHDIEQRISTVSTELQDGVGSKMELSESDKIQKQLMERMLKELERSKSVYEEKLMSGALQMAWVIGAIWTKQRQQELAIHFAGTLHSLRLSSDPDYAHHIEVASKEILPGKSSLLGNSSYASLQLEYTSSSDQSPQSQTSRVPTPRQGSQVQINSVTTHEGPRGFAESLFAFVPEYHVDAMLELCNTLRLYMHPTISINEIVEWEDMMVSCAAFLCAEFADQRIVLASTRESLVQTLAFGDREPTVNNMGAKVDAGLMSQCFGPCPSEVIQGRIRDYLAANPKDAASFLNSLLSQLNWAFSEFITMMQEILMAVISRVCVRGGGGAGFARLVARGLPDTDRVHYYVALAPVAGCLIRLLEPELSADHLIKVSKAIVSEPLFRIDGLEFMLGKSEENQFSFYNYPDDVTTEELTALEDVVSRLRVARDAVIKVSSPGSSGTQSELLCTICYARPADTAFVPCGHHSCRPCIMQHLLNSKQCFFCKADIESVREIEATNN